MRSRTVSVDEGSASDRARARGAGRPIRSRLGQDPDEPLVVHDEDVTQLALAHQVERLLGRAVGRDLQGPSGHDRTDRQHSSPPGAATSRGARLAERSVASGGVRPNPHIGVEAAFRRLIEIGARGPTPKIEWWESVRRARWGRSRGKRRDDGAPNRTTPGSDPSRRFSPPPPPPSEPHARRKPPPRGEQSRLLEPGSETAPLHRPALPEASAPPSSQSARLRSGIRGVEHCEPAPYSPDPSGSNLDALGSAPMSARNLALAVPQTEGWTQDSVRSSTLHCDLTSRTRWLWGCNETSSAST
jgi:hypothetical protein